MPTADEHVNLALKRFLSQNRMETNFRKFLDDMIRDGLSRIFPASGLFTFPVTFAFPGAGLFTLNTDPIEGIDDGGHVCILDGVARTANIAWEDDGASVYWVAYKYIKIPSGVYNNPRTGVPEYDKQMEEVGELDNPTSVTDLGGGLIQLNVNSILESGVDHGGRTVRVWLENPMSSDAAVAFEDCLVSYAAPDNTIDTTGSLGQSTISTLVTDYKVACLGVTVRKSVMNPFTAEYIMLGSMNSAGGPSYNNGTQVDFSGGGGHTLQRAYTGAGAGAGKDITADYQAVQLIQTATIPLEKDVFNAALRLRKDTNTAIISLPEWVYEGGIDSAHRALSAYSFAHRMSISDASVNDDMRPEEDVDLAVGTNHVNFTRAGVNLNLPASTGKIQIAGGACQPDLCEIMGSTLGQDGVYLINAINAAAQLDLINIDGTSPVFVAESVKARIFRLHMAVGQLGQTVFAGANDFLVDLGSIPIGIVKIVSPDSDPTVIGLAVSSYDATLLATVQPGIFKTTEEDGYQWLTTKNFYLTIDGTEGRSSWDSANGVPCWAIVSASLPGGHSVAASTFAGAGVAGYITYPLHLMKDADVVANSIEVLYNNNNVNMTIEVIRVKHNFGGVTPGSPSVVDSVVTAASPLTGITALDLLAVPYDEEYSYAIRMLSSAVTQVIYGIRVAYGVDALLPSG